MRLSLSIGLLLLQILIWIQDVVVSLFKSVFEPKEVPMIHISSVQFHKRSNFTAKILKELDTVVYNLVIICNLKNYPFPCKRLLISMVYWLFAVSNYCCCVYRKHWGLLTCTCTCITYVHLQGTLHVVAICGCFSILNIPFKIRKYYHLRFILLFFT